MTNPCSPGKWLLIRCVCVSLLRLSPRPRKGPRLKRIIIEGHSNSSSSHNLHCKINAFSAKMQHKHLIPLLGDLSRPGSKCVTKNACFIFCAAFRSHCHTLKWRLMQNHSNSIHASQQQNLTKWVNE